MRSLIILALCLSFAICQSFTYDEQLAQDLAGFSLTTYCQPQKIVTWTCGLACEKNPQGLTDVVVLRNSTMDASGFIGYSVGHDAIVVAFRGTVPWSIKNWLRDLNTIKVEYPLCDGCYVHQGFYKQFNDLKSQLITSFKQLKEKYPQSKVFVTGHSLGGAMSTHSIPLIYELNGNKPIDAYYNFGTPRVGDDTFADWFNNQNFALQYARITNALDPVPHLPPLLFPFDFRHHNHEVFYKSFTFYGKQNTKCFNAEDRSCAEGVLLAVNIPDHLTYFSWDWSLSILTCQ